MHHDYDDIKPLSPENQERLSSTMFDVPRNSSLKLHFKESAPEHLTYENAVNNNSFFSTVKDAVTKRFHSSPPLSTDGTSLSLNFDETFEYGKVYRVELNPNAYLQFENKDPSIQTMVLEMEDDPNEEAEYDVCIPKENVPAFDLNKVSEEKVEDNELMSFLYSDTVPTLQKGDLFIAKTPSNGNLGIADFYDIYESKAEDGGKTKIYYSEPKGEDIYDALRLKGVKPIDLSGLQVTATKEYILGYTYNLTNNYTTDYDISLKTYWGVPVGIDYKVKNVFKIQLNLIHLWYLSNTKKNKFQQKHYLILNMTLLYA